MQRPRHDQIIFTWIVQNASKLAKHSIWILVASFGENLESKYSNLYNLYKWKEENTNPIFNHNKPHLCNKYIDNL